MSNYTINYEGWDGNEEIRTYARCMTDQLLDRGAQIEEVLLIIKPSEMFNRFFYLYDPGERLKSYLIRYTYKDNPVCVNIDSLKSTWENCVRNGVNESLRRCDLIDNSIKINSEK